MTTDLAQRQTITALVGTYQRETAAVATAYELLRNAEANLQRDFFNQYFTVRSRGDYGSYDAGALKSVLTEINRQAWRSIVERLGIRALLSIARREELDRQLSGDSRGWQEKPAPLPEVTEENIISMMQDNMSRATEYANEAIFEVFDWLRPHHGRTSDLKTNSKWRIGQRVIIGWAVEAGYGKYPRRFRYDSEKRFNALESVFSLLDGKGPIKGHNATIIQALNGSPDGTGETEYFKFKGCKNGNIHIEFKRMDIVQKINKTAGNRTQLPL